MPFVTAWLLDPEVLHLNHGSFGATPAAVLEAQQIIRTRIEANPTRFFLEGEYQDSLDEARRVVARFVGADDAGLVFVTNATAGVNAVLRSLEPSLAAGDEILVTDHEYNACANAAAVSASRAGAVVTTAAVPFPLEDRSEVVDAVLSAVTDRTRVLLIDAVTSATGLVMPIAELAAQLEPAGAGAGRRGACTRHDRLRRDGARCLLCHRELPQVDVLGEGRRIPVGATRPA